MPEISPFISFPGVDAVIGCNYTCSHGISPGTATLTCVEQPALPAMVGDLVIGDGVTSVKIPGCRVVNIKLATIGGERIWTVFLQDRRWKWLGYGTIFGCYNQLDPNNKLIGWTIRSPAELATLCLANMGEQNYVLNLPPGLTRAWGANLQNFLQAGQNFPLTGLNPPINWNGENPAIALQQVAEQFGCRVVYDVINDRVLVVPIGLGNSLPDGYVKQYGPSIKDVPLPDGIIVIGDRTKFQMRLLMEPVGLEWDGSYRPLEQLSYAPILPGRKQISKVRIRAVNNPLGTSAEWSLTIDGNVLEYVSNPGDDLASVVAGLLNAINGAARLGPVLTATSSGLDITLTGRQDGRAFPVVPNVHGHFPDDPTLRVELVQGASSGGRGFDYSDPHYFSNVISTDRLTYAAARQLALASVFRCYRVANTGLDGRSRIYVPGYGFIVRRQQLQLTDTMVEQITPELPNENILRRDQNLDPRAVPAPGMRRSTEFIENFYNGYSRDKPAVAYGSFALSQSNDVFYLRTRLRNTAETDRIFVDFTVDPVWQVITFANPVFRALEDGSKRKIASKVTLETGCYLREADTNQFACFTLSRRFNAGGPTSFYETQRHEDVQLGVIAKYRFVRTGGVPGSGRVQIATIEFRNNKNRAQPHAAYTEAGTWTIRIGAVVYQQDSAPGDTPLAVATAFANFIPSTAQIQVALVPGTPRLTITGVQTGFAFAVEADPPDPPTPTNPFYQPFAVLAQIIQPPVADQADFRSQLLSANILEADPIFRANYYLNGMMLKYQVKATATVVYNTIMLIACDGAIAQVTWEVGDGRPVQTTASLNCEHSDWVPPYPARRRVEVLPPALQQNVLLDAAGGLATAVGRIAAPGVRP